MTKADIVELAEHIIQEREKRELHGSPRYVQRPVADPRPKIGPLSANYRPDEEDKLASSVNPSGEFYEEIPSEGLYLKPLDGSYVDLTKIKPDQSPSTKSKHSEYELEDVYTKKDKDDQNEKIEMGDKNTVDTVKIEMENNYSISPKHEAETELS